MDDPRPPAELCGRDVGGVGPAFRVEHVVHHVQPEVDARPRDQGEDRVPPVPLPVHRGHHDAQADGNERGREERQARGPKEQPEG